MSRCAPWLALHVALGLAVPTMASGQDPTDIPTPVLRWMECVECSSGELARVVSMGQLAVPVLRHLLLEGPPGAFVTRMEASLRALLGSPAPPPGAGAERQQAAITRQLEDYIRSYRIRAAAGLGAIGGPQARRALCAARSAGLDSGGLGDALGQALAQIGRPAC